MRKVFEGVVTLLFILYLGAELGRGKSWRGWLVWAFLLVGAAGGALTLWWKWKG